MSKIDDKLNEVLGIAEDVTYENEVPKKVSTEVIVPEDKDPDIDFETGRKNLYNLLDKGNEAIDGILNLAKEGEHPRAYEVAGQLIKTVSETCFLSFSSYFCWSHHGQSAGRSRSYPPYGSVKAGNRYGTSAILAFGSHYDL